MAAQPNHLERYAVAPQGVQLGGSMFQNAPPANAMQWARGGPYMTQLPPAQERMFRNWVRQNNVPFGTDNPVQDYDMRGFWQGMRNNDPHATSGVNSNDGRLHYTDWWKTPYHETFSAESQWALPNAPRWNADDQLVTPDGRVLFDDRVRGWRE